MSFAHTAPNSVEWPVELTSDQVAGLSARVNTTSGEDNTSFGRFNDNAADFPSPEIGHAKFTQLAAIVTQADTAAAGAASGETSMATDQKGGSREDLVALARQISDTARAMETDFPGIGPALHLKRGLNDADLIARCQAIHADSASFEANMISYSLAATFRADFNTITDFQTFVTGQASAVEGRVGANATLEALVDTGMQIKRTLDAVVRNKYDGVPGKIASWHSASHVEAAPKKATPPTPPTP
jgi:hypothetical protein